MERFRKGSSKLEMCCRYRGRQRIAVLVRKPTICIRSAKTANNGGEDQARDQISVPHENLLRKRSKKVKSLWKEIGVKVDEQVDEAKD